MTVAALTPERLHALYARKIARQIGATLGADHEREDLVQEVLISVFRSIGTLRNPACLDRWVAQVTSNTLKRVMRQRRLRRCASLETLQDHQIPSFEPNPHARELALRVIRVMNALPANDRALLATYWFGPATLESLAAEKGCSTVTVRRRLFRARLRFEKLARRDPALARCIEDARARSRRWRVVPKALAPVPIGQLG